MRKASLLVALALLGCSAPELTAPEDDSSAAVSVSDMDLTTFVIDTPQEKKLLDRVAEEGKVVNVDFTKIETETVPRLIERADRDVKTLIDAGTLTKVEVASLYFYTTAAYAWVNKPLRERFEPHLRRLAATIQTTSSAINKLPSFECTVKRGTGLPPEVLDRLQVGATFREPAFMSTTLGRIPKQFVKAVELKVHSRRCRNISWASEYPNEKEVLFPPGSSFKVTERTACKQGVREVCISLDEIERANARVPTGSEETEASNGAKGVDQSFVERDFTNKRFTSRKDPTKYVHFSTTRKGTWLNTQGTNEIRDWVLDKDANVIEAHYVKPGAREETKGYFMVLSETQLGRLRGPASDKIDEYYEVSP